MKICIYGAGAIGGYIAGHLAQLPDVEVSVVARGAHLQALRERGLRVTTPDRELHARVTATERAADLGPQDYVFITLKSHQVTPALDDMQALLGPETAVLPPTTGIPYWYFFGVDGPLAGRRLEALDPGGRQWTMLDPRRVIGCVYWLGAESPAPGVVRQDGRLSGLPIGEPDGSMSPRVQRLADVMQRAGLAAPMRADIRGEIWMKMINSMCWNPVAALTGATLGEIAQRPEIVDLVGRMMGEAEAVAEAVGARLPVAKEKRIAATLRLAHHKMSMLQDLERGRPIEIDVLKDSIVAMRDLVGLTTPTIDTLLDLVRLRASTRQASHGA